jgi:two-component system sensor histidine kinase KdpD
VSQESRIGSVKARTEVHGVGGAGGIPPAAQNGHTLLAVIGCNIDSREVLSWTRARAEDLGSAWIALYVETRRAESEGEQEEVSRHLSLAREMGAEVISLIEPDITTAIARVMTQRCITEIVVGVPSTGSRLKQLRSHLGLGRLLPADQHAVVHIVPTKKERGERSVRKRRLLARSGFPQYVTVVGAVALVTVAAFVFTPIVGAHATALVFLLAVVLLALILDRGPTLLAAALSAISWDFFFLPPVLAFRIKHFEDAMLCGMYFVVALVLGQLTTRIRAQEEAERRRQERATALFLLTRELSQASGFDELAQKIVQQTASAFGARVAFLSPKGQGDFQAHAAGSFVVPPGDYPVISWVLQHGQVAGRFTRNHPQSAVGMYTPLLERGNTVAVLGLDVGGPGGLRIHQQKLLEDFSQQIVLALDRERLSRLSEEARMLAESERLSKTLLDSMSHEMRTPLAAIRSATGNLAEMSETSSTELQREMIGEIEEATERLNRLVGNIIEASRLESGKVRPRLNECDIADLVHVAVAEAEEQLSQHRLTVRLPGKLPLIRLDFVLMQQVLGNLLSNAALHTPAGTAIELSATVQDGNLVFVVSDDGPGIPPESLGRIFDKFYRAPNAPSGGTGLGLSLVKGFVEAHGGKVSAENRPGSGAVITVSLPMEAGTMPEQSHDK